MRLRRSRPDPHELAAERLRSGMAAFEPLPEQLRRSHRRKILLYVVLGAVVLAILRDGLGRGAPPVHGSCTKPAFAFDRSSVREGGAVKWSVAGPPGSSVIVTADSASPGEGRLLGPVALTGCQASGVFGVPLKDGTYVLRVFLLGATGATTVVGTKTITVSAVG